MTDDDTIYNFDHWLEETYIDNADKTCLEKAVADCLYCEDSETFLNDVLDHGCISGLVTELIYYTDTHAFFDHHYEDIVSLRHDCTMNFGETLPIPPEHDLKNWLAWWAFETTCYNIQAEWQQYKSSKQLPRFLKSS